MKYTFPRRAFELLMKAGKAKMSTRLLYAIFASVFIIDVLVLILQFTHTGSVLVIDSVLLA